MLNITEKELENIFKQASIDTHIYDKRLFDEKGITYLSYSENLFLQQLTASIVAQTHKEIKNLTQTSALKMISQLSGKAITIPKYFEQTLDLATAKITTGVQTYDQAIKETISKMVDKGITVVRYEGEDKRPVNRRIETVVRANVLTGVRQLARTNKYKEFY